MDGKGQKMGGGALTARDDRREGGALTLRDERKRGGSINGKGQLGGEH